MGPPDMATRPITDRVKTSLFDVLSPRLPGARVYDIFSGTGSLGLEALSRGADSCVFFERHRPAAVRLKKNIEALGLEGRCRIIGGDVLRLSTEDLGPLPRPDMVFVDPPYPLVRDRAEDLKALLARLARHASDEGVIVLRLDKTQKYEPGLPVIEERTWGSMRVLMLTTTIDLAKPSD
jgi:16S rRNA (guanine(966)-N(2))-methyltransferase RsmD